MYKQTNKKGKPVQGTAIPNNFQPPTAEEREKAEKAREEREQRQQEFVAKTAIEGISQIVGFAERKAEIEASNPKKSITTGKVRIKCDSLTINF